jgi:hypothetical protein
MRVLRRTAASAWLAAGVDVVSVAAWLGDIVATVLETWPHLMPDADDRGAEAMDALFPDIAALSAGRPVVGCAVARSGCLSRRAAGGPVRQPDSLPRWRPDSAPAPGR